MFPKRKGSREVCIFSNREELDCNNGMTLHLSSEWATITVLVEDSLTVRMDSDSKPSYKHSSPSIIVAAPE